MTRRIDQTVRPIARSLQGRSGEATDRSKPLDNVPTLARVAPEPRGEVRLADEMVTFRWRDSAHDNAQKLLTLSLDEFLRRFLLHVLPKGFVRIRHFGFLAHRRRADFLPLCFHLLGSTPKESRTEQEASASDCSSHLWFCPQCGGPMVVLERLTADQIQLRSPPLMIKAVA
jgi:Putative transposase